LRFRGTAGRQTTRERERRQEVGAGSARVGSVAEERETGRSFSDNSHPGREGARAHRERKGRGARRVF